MNHSAGVRRFASIVYNPSSEARAIKFTDSRFHDAYATVIMAAAIMAVHNRGGLVDYFDFALRPLISYVIIFIRGLIYVTKEEKSSG